MEPLTLIISALIGILSGAVSGILAARWEIRKDIAEDTRRMRKPAYKELWHLSGQLPRYPGTKDLGIVKLGELYDLSVKMADWYFNSDGGLIMSEETKKKYMGAQETIEKVLLEGQDPDGSRLKKNKPALILRQRIADIALERENYLRVQKKFSALRTEMTKDLLSRNRSFF